MKWLLPIIIILCLSSVLAYEPSNYYVQNELVDIKAPCHINNGVCSYSTVCNITINYPNNTNYVNQAVMTRQGSYFNYTIASSSVLGDYNYCVDCVDLSTSEHGYSCEYLEVNNLGRREAPIMIGIYLALILASLTAFYLSGTLKLVDQLMNILLLFTGFAQLLAILFISYLDYINGGGVASTIMTVFIIDCLVVLALVYMYFIKRVEEDIDDLIDKDGD